MKPPSLFDRDSFINLEGKAIWEKAREMFEKWWEENLINENDHCLEDQETAKKIYAMVCKFFNNDHKKTLIWFGVKNPLLGGAKPVDMLSVNREEKLLKIVKEAIEGNFA